LGKEQKILLLDISKTFCRSAQRHYLNYLTIKVNNLLAEFKTKLHQV